MKPKAHARSATRSSRLAIPVFLLWGLLGIGEVTSAQTVTSALPVTVLTGHGKGLSEILDQIQLAFRTPINFEEAPLQNDDDIRVVKISGLQPKRVSRASDLSVTLTGLDSTPYLATQSAISAYINAGYPGTYGVFEHDNRIDILPISVKGASGSLEATKPILATTLTFPALRRTVADTVETIVDAASQRTGHRILIVSLPGPAMQTIELGADSQSLGDVIENLATALHTTFSVRLHYVVDEGSYYIDFRGVSRLDPAGKPWVPSPPKHPATVGPLNSPFFTKAQ